MKFPALFFSLLLPLVPPALGGEEIKVHVNPENENAVEGLVVLFPKEIAVTKELDKLSYTLVNRTKSHLFVVIESKNIRTIRSEEGGGGGMFRGAENTHEKLRLLYSPKNEAYGNVMSGEMDHGSRTLATVNVRGGGGENLMRYIGKKGSLTLSIKFYVDGVSDERRETITVPLEFHREQIQAEKELLK